MYAFSLLISFCNYILKTVICFLFICNKLSKNYIFKETVKLSVEKLVEVRQQLR